MRLSDEPLLRHVPATVHGRFLVSAPATAVPKRWLVGFHGYAQNAAVFFDMLRIVPGSSDWLVASVQALHPFYAGRSNEVVANWMTRQDREHAIADNIAYVDTVTEELAAEFGSPSVLVFAGFSQGVAMAYRAGVAGRMRCHAVFAAGGDLPPELKDSVTRPWPRIVLCTGTRDEFFTPRRLNDDLEFLRSSRIDAEAAVFDGGHEWSTEVTAAAGRLLAGFPAET